MKAFRILAYSCFLALLQVSQAFAVPPKPAIFITAPHNSQPIYFDPPDKVSPIYDDSDESIGVLGIFTDVSQDLIDRADVAISVNGSMVPAGVSFTSSRTVDGIVYRSGIFSARTPLLHSLLWPLRPVVAEIVNIKTWEALARHQVSVYDLRVEPDSTPDEELTTDFFGLRSQITDRGIGHRASNDTESGLEPQLRKLLPSPSLDSFNDILSSRARNISRYDNDANVLRACIRLTKLEETRLADEDEFPAYKEALDEAKRKFRNYRAAKKTCKALPPPQQAGCLTLAESTHCIKKKPEAKHFELCVDQIEGKAKSLTIDNVRETGLNFEYANTGTRGLLSAHQTISNLTGKLDGYLRSLSVQWRGDLCVNRPEGEFNDGDISGIPWLNDWATCRNITLVEGIASTELENHPATYEIKRDVSNIERHKVSFGTAGEFGFSQSKLRSNKGTCGLDFISDAAATMAETFRTPFRQKLQNTWYRNQPDTMEAVSLTKMLAPYRLGEVTVPNLDFEATVGQLTSDAVSGLQTTWITNVASDNQTVVENQKINWFYAPPRGTMFSPDGFDHRGNRFGIAYSVTTAFLNRLLNVRVAAPQGLYQIYKPTWGELASFGVRTPAGKSTDQKAVLNGVTLAQFDPAFLSIGAKKLEIHLEPIIDPIVYMPPDVTAQTEIPNVGAATVYGMESLQVTFKEKDRVVDGNPQEGKVWLRALIAFADPEFKFAITEKAGAKFLKPTLKSDLWRINIIKSALPLCKLNFSGPVAGPSRCEARMERAVLRLIKTKYRELFLKFLEKVPAPQYFDAAGEASEVRFFDGKTRRQENQFITFYGDFK